MTSPSRKILISVIIALLILISGWFLYINYYKLPDILLPEILKDLAEIKEKQEVVHPISLKALMQKDFTGTDLTLGRVLASNSSYTRYYITYLSEGLKNFRHYECTQRHLAVSGFNFKPWLY